MNSNKFTLSLAAIMLLIASAFTACEKIDLLNIDTEAIYADAEGGVFQIAVSSNGEWTAVVEDAENNSWITLDNTSGTNNGIITVNIAENTLFETRKTTIRVSMGSLNEIVVVKQEAREEPLDIPFTEISLFEIGCAWRITSPMTIINSREELEKHIVCFDSTFPEFDFSNYTVLVTRGSATTSPIIVDSISFLKVDAEKYVMTVRIQVGFLASPGSWRTPILVPKMPNDVNVELIVERIN